MWGLGDHIAMRNRRTSKQTDKESTDSLHEVRQHKITYILVQCVGILDVDLVTNFTNENLIF